MYLRTASNFFELLLSRARTLRLNLVIPRRFAVGASISTISNTKCAVPSLLSLLLRND